MKKGTKCYSINGKLTKRGREDIINGYNEDILKYESVKNYIANVPLTHNDCQTIVDIMDKYISGCKDKINRYTDKKQPDTRS